MNSMETGQANFENAFSDKAIRQGFIRKVYSLLCCQLLITFTFIIITNQVPAIAAWLVVNFWIVILAIISMFFIMIPMLCIKSLRRSSPTNYILLFSFTICYSIPLSFVGALFETDAILIAAVITGLIVVGLTIFSIQTKIDFTFCTGIIFVILLCFILTGISFGIVAATQPNDKWLSVIWAGMGAALIALFIVIDTQMIVGGGRELEISPEEYCYAAFVLYIDIVRMFLYILQIVAELKN